MQNEARTVSFTAMKDGTRDDYMMLRVLEEPFHKGTADRVLKALREQDDETLEGYKISRLTHGLQCATRAWRDGADLDWVVAALLHDIGDGLAPQNHDEYAASIIRPFMREEVVWTVQHHGTFQMLYYGHHYGWDRNERDKYKGQPNYESCAQFCEKWDQSSFDPDYDTLPLSFFEAMVREVFARSAYKPEIIQAGVKWPIENAEVAKTRAA